MTRATGRHSIPILLALLPWLGCAGTRAPAPSAVATADSGSVSDTAVAVPDAPPATDTAAAMDSVAAAPIDQTIPPDYLPPPGQCRQWIPGEPLERQVREHPVGRCSELRRALPEDRWLIYRPADTSGIVRVWRYDGEGQVVSQRIHDVETGTLLRHVAPAGS